MTYDSTDDTLDHIARVQQLLGRISSKIGMRAIAHDRSKLREPEKTGFDEFTPRLQELTYGTDEYSATLAEMKPIVDHHYAHNDHHPEHFPDEGVYAMNLLQLLEMLADWKAAGERHANPDKDPKDVLSDSITTNVDRFKIPPLIERQLVLTAAELGWM